MQCVCVWGGGGRGGRCQIDPPKRKLPSKNPVLLGLRAISVRLQPTNITHQYGNI